MKAILILAILLMLVGTAESGKLIRGPHLKVPHDSQVSYELLSGIGLLTGVPGFAAGWAVHPPRLQCRTARLRM